MKSHQFGKRKPIIFMYLIIFVWIKVLLHISLAGLYYLAVLSNTSASIRVNSEEEKLGIWP